MPQSPAASPSPASTPAIEAPAAPGSAGHTANIPGAPSSPTADGRILLAQDNPIILRVVALLLQKLGYNVDLAHSGPEAVAFASASQYDLMLIGCRDAIDTVAQIRHQEGPLRRTPIIAVITNKADWDRCKEAGADDFLTIPVNLDPLRKLLARWLTGTAG